MSSSLVSDVREALERAGITGTHRSHERRGSISKIDKLAIGDPDATFGLSGLESFSAQEVLSFMSELTGCPGDIADVACDDWIDPERTVSGIVAAAERLRDFA